MSQKAYRFTSAPSSRSAILLRMGLCGPAGSGKSWTALMLASYLANRLKLGPAYVIDSENGSAMRYARSVRTGRGFDFIHVPLPSDDYSPAAYIAAIEHCERECARVILVDGISPEWEGPKGVLEQVDEITEQASRGGKQASAFSSGWKTMTPQHTRFVQRMLSSSAHLIFTVRAKVTYEIRKDDRGRNKPEKVGLGPVQRSGIEYEPDAFAWMNQVEREDANGRPCSDPVLTMDKSRIDTLRPGTDVVCPGEDFAELVALWIEDSVPAQDQPGDDREPARQERRPEPQRQPVLPAQQQSNQPALLAWAAALASACQRIAEAPNTDAMADALLDGRRTVQPSDVPALDMAFARRIAATMGAAETPAHVAEVKSAVNKAGKFGEAPWKLMLDAKAEAESRPGMRK